MIRFEADAPNARNGAPGQTAGHYAPRTPLHLPPPGLGAINLKADRVGWLRFREDQSRSHENRGAVEYLSAAGDLREAATRLFAALRRLDEAGLDLIVAEAVPEEGLGRAIMDRLRRAAAGSGPG